MDSKATGLLVQSHHLRKGELAYDGRRVNPAKFKEEGKDLRKLVGRCTSCGCTLRGKKAIPNFDSYDSEINNDYTLIVQCEECDERSADDI